MAELAVTDGMPPPAGLPDGECICSRLDDGGIRVDRADPRILISPEVLDAIAEGGPWPASLRLDTAGCMPPPYRGTHVGAVLHIDGVNQQVVYRITEYVPRIRAYIGEWPD